MDIEDSNWSSTSVSKIHFTVPLTWLVLYGLRPVFSRFPLNFGQGESANPELKIKLRSRKWFG